MCHAVFVFRQRTADEMRISDWSSDVCSSELRRQYHAPLADAIDARVRLLDEITGGSTADVDQARLEFARRFNDIDAQMMEANDAEALDRTSSCRERVWQYV